MKLPEGHIVPTIRIQKIEMENFKSVRYGEVLFNCGRKVVPQDTEADILGIYGQNGSGKTSVIEAIAILKSAMSGYSISDRYSECISKWAPYAKLSFVLDLQYTKGEDSFARTVTYSFKIESVPNDKDSELNEMMKKIFKNDKDNEKNELMERIIKSSIPSTKVKIFDEVISASGLFGGEIQKKQDILTTSGGNYPIGPVRKIEQYVGNDKEAVVLELSVNQRTAENGSMSFIFMKDTLELFYKHSNNSEYYQVLMELRNYARSYLYTVIDTRDSGIAKEMPLYTRMGGVTLDFKNTKNIPDRFYKYLENVFKEINLVLPTVVADMELVIDSNEYDYKKETLHDVKYFSKRKDTIIPLEYESAGIIKLVGILSLVIAAFNDRSITVAIDEFDAGIYEYLLGEILTGLEAYGKGQFIFTSHNLRPLEVLKKESLIFTTSNPDNRFIRLKGVGRTNNLRNLYLREILGNTQDEQIYDAAKRQRMIAAFMKAGVGIAQEE